MSPEQRLADYLAGVLTSTERAELETELAANPEALRELVQQRRLDAALRPLLDEKSEPIQTAILASIRGVSDDAAQTRVLKATAFAQPARHWPRAWEALFQQGPVGSRWRWAAVAAALVAVGFWASTFWGHPPAEPGGRSLPARELASLNLEPDLLRELAPLVAAPPVWTGSEQQSAWLTALAAATAAGENE
jgi:anti-sigma-K factor RskA